MLRLCQHKYVVLSVLLHHPVDVQYTIKVLYKVQVYILKELVERILFCFLQVKLLQ